MAELSLEEERKCKESTTSGWSRFLGNEKHFVSRLLSVHLSVVTFLKAGICLINRGHGRIS